REICVSWGVRSSRVSSIRLRACSPVASSSTRARSANPSMPSSGHSLGGGAGGSGERRAIKPFGRLAIAEERPRARLEAERPVRSTGLSVGREPLQGVGSRLRLPAADGGLDQLRQRQRGEQQLVRVLAVLLSRGQRLLVAAQSVVEQRTRPPDDG